MTPVAARGRIVLAAFSLAAAFAALAAPPPLPAYGADAGKTTVSGLSSGAFMAVQLQVAYSASIAGGQARHRGFAGGSAVGLQRRWRRRGGGERACRQRECGQDDAATGSEARHRASSLIDTVAHR